MKPKTAEYRLAMEPRRMRFPGDGSDSYSSNSASEKINATNIKMESAEVGQKRSKYDNHDCVTKEVGSMVVEYTMDTKQLASTRYAKHIDAFDDPTTIKQNIEKKGRKKMNKKKGRRKQCQWF